MFPTNIIANVSPKRLNRFFSTTDDGFRINTEIREMVVFAKHNIILHPPFTKIDILTCRNLLIYMDVELQKKLMGLFYYSINPHGYLVLGSAETLGTQGHFFATVDSKLKIFKRSDTNDTLELIDFPSSFSRTYQPNIEKQNPLPSLQNIQTPCRSAFVTEFFTSGCFGERKG